MANSKYEYVKNFEQPDHLLPDTYIVIRIDGRGFHKFSNRHGFEKPNDKRAIELMNAAALGVMGDLTDLVLGYGVSDEFSFVFRKGCTLFERRESKLVTTLVSTFTAYYIHLWPRHFPNQALSLPLPTFDGRAVLYPSARHIIDYMSWRQADCHINNLFNTTFWALVQKGGMSPQEAEQELSGTLSSDKNEILFKRFGMNYNNEEDVWKKGSVIFRDFEVEDTPTQETEGEPGNDRLEAETSPKEPSKTQAEKQRKARVKAKLGIFHIDIIREEFWTQRPWLLSDRPGKLKILK